MAQTKIGFTGKLRPAGVDQTAGQNLRMLAGLSDQVGELAFNQVAKTRQKEGALAGAQSVKRDEQGKVLSPELESDNTIFGQSFNQSAILAHKAQVSMDSRESLDRLQEEHKLDPEAFKVAAMGMRKGTLTGMPEELAVLVGQDIDSSISNRHAKLLDSQFKRESEQQRATALASIETQQNEILNSAREGDTEQHARLMINANAELDAWVESGKISPNEAENLKTNTIHRSIVASEVGEIDRLLTEDPTSETIKNASEYIDKLKGKFDKEFPIEKKDALIAKAESTVNSAINGLTRQKSANKAALRGEIKTLNKKISAAKVNLNNGIKVNQEEIDLIIERSQQVNLMTGEDSIDLAELNSELMEAQQVNTFSLLPGAAREAQERELINLERQAKLSIEGGEMLTSIRKANARVESQIKSKGIEYYQEQGIKNIGQLSLIGESGELDIDGFIDGLDERKAIALEAGEHYKQDISPLTNSEADDFGRLYNSLPANDKGKLLSAMVQGLGDQSIPALEQFANKGADVMALSGAIINDGGNADLILQGQELLKEAGGKALLPSSGFDMSIATALGHTYIENPQQRAASVKAIKAAYAAISAEKGGADESGMVDDDLLEQAINTVTGGIVEYNDVKTPVPVRGMTESKFEDMIEGLSITSFNKQDQILPFAADEMDEVIEQIQDNGTFHAVGPGEYIIKIGEGSLVGNDGKAYVLDFRRLINE